ncbi:MAG: ROK family protein [Planctomycetota bacterium]
MAVGVGCAGQTDHRRGELVFGNNLGVRNVQVARELSRRLQLPVGVENDVNAIGLGEACFGAARGARDLIAVFVGTGIGGGSVRDGAVVRGKSGAAAEVGHAISVPDGRACNCGQRGCYEAYCSGRAFEEIGRELMAAGEWPAEAGERLTSAGLRVAARRSQLAADHLRRAEEAIAYLGANLVTLLDPEVLVLGGGVVLHDRAFVGAVKSGIARHATLVARRDVRVELTALGEDAALLGAAAIGFEVLTKNGK